MRLVRNIILFIVALYIGAVIFMPKSQLYYFAEKQLKNRGIVIGNEKLTEKIAFLNVQHPVVYFQGVDVARAANIKITPLLLVNRLEANSVELLNIAKKFIDININTLTAKQSIFNLYRIKIDATGSF